MNNESDIPIVALRQSFQLFEQFAETAVGWDVGFRQLDHSASPFYLEQFSSPRLLYTRGRFGCSFHQLGGPTVGFRTFALQSEHCTDFRWCGEAINAHDLIVFPVGGEFESVSQSGFDIFTVSIADELLELTAQTQFQRPLSTYLGPGRQVCHRPGGVIVALRNEIQQLAVTMPNEAVAVAELEATLAYLVLACLDSGKTAAPKRTDGQRNRVCN
jgi:hypothetical protein